MARLWLSLFGAVASAKKYKIGTADYAPYNFEKDGKWTGFCPDMAAGMTAMCDDVEIEVVPSAWNDCWKSDDSGLGSKLDSGELDACMSYTHTHGIRNQFADFGWAVLKVNKPAGLLALLDKEGKQTISSTDDMNGKKVADVGGWAPTPDTFALVTNKCTDKKYTGYTMLSADGNDATLKMLLNKEADAVYIYGDQPKNLLEQCKAGEADASVTDCTMWKKFGTEFAFVQSGKFGYSQNGTTFILTKKGSKVNEEINVCQQKYMESKEYYDLCKKYPSLYKVCYKNSHFPADPPAEVKLYMKETDELDEYNSTCAKGYCPCEEATGGNQAGNQTSDTSGCAAATAVVSVLTVLLGFAM